MTQTLSLHDNDLVSIQEARILLEHLEEARGVLEGLPASLVDRVLSQVGEGLLANVSAYAELSVAQSDYGTVDDERALIEWVLTDLLGEVRSQPDVGDLLERAGAPGRPSHVEVALPKGVVASLVPDWLAVPTLLSQALCAIKAKCPIVFSARPRVHAACAQVVRDLRELAAGLGYPTDALCLLSTYSPEGEEWLLGRGGVRMVIDSREYESLSPRLTAGKDVYHATVGNNPVFVEHTADLALCADQVVRGASLCCGMLPGAEQSIVAEAEVSEALKGELRSRGCRFLSDEESERLVRVLFAPDGTPHRELIAKTARDLARRADIPVSEDTLVLVTEKPYVSETSLYSRAKFGPVLSYYVEESWQNACEKCIELILGSGHGNALAIFSQDPEVVRQFVLRKPVGRVLVNVGTGLGSTGLASSLSKTLTITGWDVATTSGLGVTHADFVRWRQVGASAEPASLELLRDAGARKPGDCAAVPPEPVPDRITSTTSTTHTSATWFSSLLESVRQEHEEQEI